MRIDDFPQTTESIARAKAAMQLEREKIGLVVVVCPTCNKEINAWGPVHAWKRLDMHTNRAHHPLRRRES